VEIIAHRRNRLEELHATPRAYGVEVDIRSMGDRLVIHHDPYVDGGSFDAWIESYAHGTLILNVKEEGLEERLIALMQAHGIERYFFLDQSFPFLIRTARAGERRCAVRFSEYESIETALAVAPMIDWVWVDCFSDDPLSAEQADRLRDAGLKLCLVSPELHGRDQAVIAPFRDTLTQRGITADAVCTKRPDLWS
jgi:hypothetical protein